MLRTRLFLGLFPLVLLIVATGGYAIYVGREVAGTLTGDIARNYRAVVAAEKMRAAATRMGTAVSQVPSGENERRIFEESRSAFMRELMEQAAASSGSTRAVAVAAVDEAFGRLGERGRLLLQVGGSGAMRDFVENTKALNAVLDAIDALTRHDVATAQDTAARVGQIAQATERLMIVAIAGGFGLALFLSWRLASSLLRPIRSLTASAVALGDGDLDREVPELSRDELGQLARAFNTMAGKLRSYRDATVARVLRAQRTMEATLTSAPDPLFVVNRDGTQEVRNPAAQQLAALPEFAAGLPGSLAEPLAEVLRTGEHYLPIDYARAVTFRLGREDRHFLPRILAVGDKLTDFSGAAIVLQDVTKFRLMDDAKTNLVGTVSHELKTPLTSLRMALYLLLEQNLSALTAQQRELIEDARADADRLLRILDTLLDLTRLESGASTLERTEVAVAALLQANADEARAIIGNAGLQLAVVVAPELAGATVNVDEARIRHVFMNLLTNAVKYSPRGGTITLSAAPDAAGFVRFS
ncbi:MAG: HAMP domain-containing protein, partial [Opitutaceae bacterium]|nr:HAMP domain-containing protein [Opitutaceae bacterium]